MDTQTDFDPLNQSPVTQAMAQVCHGETTPEMLQGAHLEQLALCDGRSFGFRAHVSGSYPGAVSYWEWFPCPLEPISLEQAREALNDPGNIRTMDAAKG